MSCVLEIACFNADAAINAAHAGADRIELCTNYQVGGLTPELSTIAHVTRLVDIPVHVMIRPRPGNFVYSAQELKLMIQTIESVKKAGAAGVVFGVLTPSQQINRVALTELLHAAQGLKSVFHRAIDECVNPDEAMATLVESGITQVLTSGASPNAIEGASRLAYWHQAVGHKIEIIAGGGVRSYNIAALKKTSQCHIFHSAAIIKPGENPDIHEIKALARLIK